MIYQPGHCNTLHPGTDKGNALASEKQAIIPVAQRPENCFEPACMIAVIVQLFYFPADLADFLRLIS
jgi:hypothetical protein